MKRTFVFSLIPVLILLILPACQSNVPIAPEITTSPVPAETTTPMDENLAYPAPAETTTLNEESSAYPAPESISTLPLDQTDFLLNIYPGPVTEKATFVDWQIAENAILEGEVAEIYQDNLLHVSLILKSGEALLTVQPATDAVSKALERCGDACRETLQIDE